VFRRLSIACLLVVGCGSEEAEAPRERPPAQVEVAEARTGDLTIRRRYLGTVRAAARAELAAGADGAVTEVAVREGDHVTRGQTLVRVDARLARAELQAARAATEAASADREQAVRDAERYTMAGTRIASELEIERAGSTAQSLEAVRDARAADVSRARATLSRHSVTAPFDGVVAARLVDQGDWVSPGTPAIELVADTTLEVFVRVEPELLVDVDVGATATLARGDRTVSARVEGVVRALDPETRTAQLRLLPTEDPPQWLLAGAAVDVIFEIHHGGEGVLVPRDALVEGVAQTRVVLIADGAAQPVDVEVLERGLTEARVRAEGESSLSAGTALVTRGNERLRPGQPVQVVEAEANADQAGDGA
tara:strand:+ start:117 stop:1214 length:1098 start_codon:yes stop_codon:yes gene_type:complete